MVLDGDSLCEAPVGAEVSYQDTNKNWPPFSSLLSSNHQASSLARVESLGPSRVFPELLLSPGHAQSPMHVCGLLDPQEYDRTF